VGVELGLVMTDQALFGISDEPAHLDGYGPIPAELAREIVAGACTRPEKLWLRRLYTSPTSGELVAMEARGRSFRGTLARFITLRDRVCRTPWCDAPIRHHDHATAHQQGGPTHAGNGQGLCQACNYAKQAPGWRARPAPHPDRPHPDRPHPDRPHPDQHRIQTTTPTGHTHATSPPVLVTIRETPIRLDYILAG
jgi:hypothetical protein